jgi:hypothetical protein
MPRSLKEILDQADDLAARFEDHNPTNMKDAAALRALRARSAIAPRVMPASLLS